MPSSTFSYTSADGTAIAACRWDPAGQPDEVIAELTNWLDRVLADTAKAG